MKVLDELVHPDSDLASAFLRDCQGFDMWIELAPLSSPIGTDLFLSDDSAALRGLGPAYVFCHQCQCTINVPLIKCRVCLLKKGLSVRHITSSACLISGAYIPSSRTNSVQSARPVCRHPQDHACFGVA